MFMKQNKLLLLLILMLLMPIMSSAEVVEINGIWYNVVPKAKMAEVIKRQNSGSYYSGDIVIPKSVTYDGVTCKVTAIANNAFYDCSNMTSVTIPSSVTSIGTAAFYGCNKLTTVTIPNSVTSLGGAAFKECSGLTTIIFNSGITTIGNQTFYKCKRLTSVTIPNSVTNIGEAAFQDCISLKSVTIPNSVIDIGMKAFQDCISLKSVTIPNSVTNIRIEAFSGCNSLASVTIGKKVTTIGDNAFYECTSLKSITIPNSVTYLGMHAFHGCSSLINATIGSGVTKMEMGVFKECFSLKSVIIPNSVTFIAIGAFYKCTSLASLTIGNSVMKISEKAFFGCTSLTSVNIPNSVTKIFSNAFDGCKNLTVVGIGSGMKQINYYAFANCEKLTDVYCYADVTCITDSYAFRGSYIEYATLHVPAGSIDAYKAKKPWSEFMNIVKITGKVKLNKSELSLQIGKTETLTPKFSPISYPDKSVTWKSSDTKVATVTSAGKVKGIKAGTATITCTSKATGTKAACKVTVGNITLNKSKVGLEKGKTVTLKATVTPSSLADKSVKWKSSDKSVATVTSKGKVKGVKYGTATITCTSVATGLSTTCKVTVGHVKLDKSEASVKKGKTVTLKATVYPTSLKDKSVTWESSNTAVATVTSAGKVKGVKAGTVTITCTSNATGLSATCTVKVTASSSTRSLDGDDDEVTGIEEEIIDDPAVVEPFDVYDLSGHKVLNQVTSLDGLPNGIYIVNGKKILKKE